MNTLKIHHTVAKDNPITWVVVADARCADIYTDCTLHGKLTLAPVTEELKLKILPHEMCMPGWEDIFDDCSPKNHLAHVHHNCRIEAKEHLLHELANKLKEAQEKGQFNRLILIAPEKIMKELESILPEETKKTIIAEICRQLTKMPRDSIALYLEETALI